MNKAKRDRLNQKSIDAITEDDDLKNNKAAMARDAKLAEINKLLADSMPDGLPSHQNPGI